MSDHAVVHNTFVIERTYPAAPDRVFAAFADPAKKRRWFAEGDHHEIEAYQLDFRVGGAETLRYRFNEKTPFKGVVVRADGSHLDIVPDRRIVTAATMVLGDHCISATLVTIELEPAGTGTKLICTHQAAFFEGADGPEIREKGWRSLFEKLAKVLSS